MSNFHTSGSNNGSSSNNNSFVSRREIRASNTTGALPVINVSERGYIGSFDFEAMLVSLHELFEHDREVASQADATRCGICYLHFLVGELQYRDEGFYMCTACEKNIGNHSISMLRHQQK